MSNLCNILVVSAELKKYVRDLYGKTDEDIKKDVGIIYDWWKKQPHLPVLEDDEYVERLLMRNKFRIEKTKTKIDAYFSVKHSIPDIFVFENGNPNCPPYQRGMKSFTYFPLKNPNDRGERILLFTIRDDVDTLDTADAFIYGFGMLELLVQHDYCASYRLIMDLKNFKFSFYKALNLALLFRGMKMYQEGYSARFSGIEYINAPSFMDLVAKLTQAVIKEGRMTVHSSLESLYSNTIPRENFPYEYGGEAGHLQDIQDLWTKERILQKDFIGSRLVMKSNEKLRQGKSPYNDMFGVEGTFKKLEID